MDAAGDAIGERKWICWQVARTTRIPTQWERSRRISCHILRVDRHTDCWSKDMSIGLADFTGTCQAHSLRLLWCESHTHMPDREHIQSPPQSTHRWVLQGQGVCRFLAIGRWVRPLTEQTLRKENRLDTDRAFLLQQLVCVRVFTQTEKWKHLYSSTCPTNLIV